MSDERNAERPILEPLPTLPDCVICREVVLYGRSVRGYPGPTCSYPCYLEWRHENDERERMET